MPLAGECVLASRGVPYSPKAMAGAMLEARGWLQLNARFEGLVKAAKESARKK